MTHFMRNGNTYAVAPAGALDITDHLPVGTYKVNFNQMTNSYFLETIENFDVSGKIYGDTLDRRDRILTTFFDRSATTGVMLTGEKGSGKTLLAKLLSQEAQKKDVPTLVINSPWCGDEFNAFMQAISQPIVVVFDEFEKVYDGEGQQKLLTLLDGTYSSKKLFILTANDRYKVDSHMMNRPGRIFYGLDFKGVTIDFVREYCNDNLVNKDYVEDVARVSRFFGTFNFDVLKALVEEMNRFDEDPEQALNMLNAKPERIRRTAYTVALWVEGHEISKERLLQQEYHGSPLTDSFRVHYRGKPNEAQKQQNESDYDLSEEQEAEVIGVILNPSLLQRVNINTGEFLFETEDGVKVNLNEKLGTAGPDYRVVW